MEHHVGAQRNLCFSVTSVVCVVCEIMFFHIMECLTEACCFVHECAAVFLKLERVRNPIFSPVLQVLENGQASVAPCGCSPPCPCANACAATQELGCRPGLVLMNSEKLPLCFSQCHVFNSVLSSTVPTLLPVQSSTGGYIQWWFILDWFKVSVKL